jgi:hypothetical protein
MDREQTANVAGWQQENDGRGPYRRR